MHQLPSMSSLILLSFQLILIVLIHHDVSVESFPIISKVHQPFIRSTKTTQRYYSQVQQEVQVAESTKDIHVDLEKEEETNNVYEIPFPFNDVDNSDEEEILYEWFNYVVCACVLCVCVCFFFFDTFLLFI